MMDGADRAALEAAMDAAASEDLGRLESLLDSMSEREKAYFTGYVAGYVEAVRHLQAAGSLESYMKGAGDGR